ncbi:major facilitator superfamily protein [Paucilactobacillus vaccinostercus DSM 20634]|uniref:Major facilitator superfamily protein n=1 Tax=Paucilactobacillus vaccinostercus DSM 20634 TaxID=1423813 RepID=A0A0R2A1M4_9LACO|nr:MFS transporter [Paucilactobacillus vaccinostercus]KRM60864.1 major facilitator superfamily protein [Paucilactobacillus vaccinostercus DSM 20634]
MPKNNQGQPRHSKRWLIMTAVFIATFMTSVEVTIVTTALPSIISELHGLAYQSWIMSAYLLTTAITTPIYGKLADTIGRKKVFLWGVIMFTLGSLFSGLATNIYMLIAMRALQGIGSGAVLPLTFTIIADNYSFEERARVLAFNNTAWGLSALIGPALGGFLVDALSWHWVFFVNVPLGVIVAVLIWGSYHEKLRATERLVIDWQGISYLAITMVGILLAVQSLDSNLVVTGVLAVVAAISLILLVRTEKRVANPLISPKLFRNPSFSIQISTTAMLSGILMAYQIYFPIWLQSIYRMPATMAGLVVSSSSIMWLIAAFFVGAVISRFVPKYVAMGVAILLVIFYTILVFAGRDFPSWMFYLIAAVNGGTIGIIISMNTILSQHFVDESMIGSATSLLTLGQSLGQTIMTGVFGAVLNLMIATHRGNLPLAEINRSISSNQAGATANKAAVDTVILHGMHGVFAVVIGLLVAVFIVNLVDPNKKVVR